MLMKKEKKFLGGNQLTYEDIWFRRPDRTGLKMGSSANLLEMNKYLRNVKQIH